MSSSQNPDLVSRVVGCIQSLQQLILSPFDGFTGQDMAAEIQSATGADAVSFFMVNPQSPSELTWKGGVGYRDPYPRTIYYRGGPSLTMWVFENGKEVNFSVRELEIMAEKKAIKYQGLCKNYLLSEKFSNIILVPITFAERPLGVLKIESKGDDPNSRFPKEDFDLARMVAPTVAIAFQQQIHSDLWRDGEIAVRTAQSPDACLQTLCGILANLMSAQCASVFLRESRLGKDYLRFRGGVGYSDAYRSHKYELTTPPTSFTGFMAQASMPLRETVDDLRQGNFHYSGSCAANIVGGAFRNIIAVPLLSGGTNIGVVKVENKLPAEAAFNHHDEAVCQSFVENLFVRCLAGAGVRGYGKLVELLGEPIPWNRLDPLPHVWRIISTRDHFPDAITMADCAKYAGVSLAHFYRFSEKARSKFGNPAKLDE